MAEDKLTLQELDLRLKEEDLKLKEAELVAKTKDIGASRWFNPVVIGLFAAAFGLAGNIVVTLINNNNTQELERSRTQSSLILEAIKTNGDTIAACKNLIFFTSLGLIEDKNHTITDACPGNVQGVPSVSVGPPDWMLGLHWYPLEVETVDKNGTPIPEVRVEVSLIPSDIQVPPDLSFEIPSNYLGTSSQTRTGRCTSDKRGNCYLGMAPSGKFIALLANKEGYDGNRTNTFFTGTSVVVVLQKSR